MSYTKSIRAQDSDAVDQLRARIAEAERLQERMKAANKIIRDRKLSNEEKIARLGTECGIPEDGARKRLRPDFAGRVGFPNYELTNNAANIRRMQARVAGLAQERARPSVVVEFPGGRMEDSAEHCRVRIYHDDKPAADLIQKLKTNGFHWSPSIKAWQRLRNDSARWAATAVVETINTHLQPHAKTLLWRQDKVPGQEAWNTIHSWIDTADLVVVVLTGKALSRALSVGNEVGYARKAGKRIIPFVAPEVPKGELGCLEGITYIRLDFDNPQQTVTQLHEALAKFAKEKEEKARAVAVLGLIALGVIAFSK